MEDPAALELGEEERSEELEQVDEKSKFAKWRVVEIKKQLMLNSTINKICSNSSPIINHNSPVINSLVNNNISSPVNFTSPPIVSHSHLPGHNSVQSSPTYSQSQAQAQVSSPPALMFDPKKLSECERLARHAISALNFDDVETAADNLRAALKVLQPYLKENK